MGMLTILVYIALSFFAGFYLITIPSGIISLDSAAAYVNQNILTSFSSSIALVLTGLLLILLCLRYIQKLLAGSRQNKNISFESKQGKVNITLGAIEDLLKKMLDVKKEVSQTRVRVSLKKKAIEVQIKSYLNHEVNLVDFTKEIQIKVKEKLQVLLGEDKKVQVNLQIRKIKVSKGEKENGEPEIPFRHYK